MVALIQLFDERLKSKHIQVHLFEVEDIRICLFSRDFRATVTFGVHFLFSFVFVDVVAV